MKYKFLILLGMIILSLNFISAYCYQESANSSTVGYGNCVLNSSGSYYVSAAGTWSNTSYAYDGDWNTNATSLTGTPAIDILYYKPSNATSTSLWQVKDSVGTFNLTIDTKCWNINPINLSVYILLTCFSGDTKIKTLFGEKEIKDIKIGDYVLSYDENLKLNNYSKVTETFHHNKNEIDGYLIVNNNLKVTPNHPMYINGNWQEIGNAKVGDKIRDINGNDIEIYSIKQVDDKIETYNLEVENTHDYYANNFLVHNKIPITFWKCSYVAGSVILRSTIGGANNNKVFEEAMIWDIPCWTKSVINNRNVTFIPKGCPYKTNKGVQG